MDEGRMVDLLLVRLSRDDEKQKVIDLLVSELGMTAEEATEKVENSPSILRENVEMEQGRILQDRMYPFVDLLPKYYRSGESPDPGAGSAASEGPRADSDIQHGVYDGAQEFELEDTEEPSRKEPEEEEELGDIIHDQSAIMDDEYVKSYDDDDDDSLIITSAAEEVLTVERCHICGRTPTNGEKLVPCTTCGELTCVACYNRKEHVCEKCAAMGRTVDRPLDSPPEEEPEAQVSRPAAPERRRAPVRRTAKPGSGLPFGLSPAVLAVVALVVLAIAFFLVDPMNMFTSGEDDAGAAAVLPDSSSVSPDTSGQVSSQDTVEVALPDTAAASPDSIGTDSLHREGPGVSLAMLSLPDSLAVPEGINLPEALTVSPVRDLEVQAESLQLIMEPLGQLLAFHDIQLEGVSLVLTPTGYDVLVMSIMHPEPAEKRAALLGNLGSLLDSTMVDQMVLYYRENQYYEPNMFSFTADSFGVLSLSTSPYFLQRKQALLPETTELVTGPVFEWMTELD